MRMADWPSHQTSVPPLVPAVRSGGVAQPATSASIASMPRIFRIEYCIVSSRLRLLWFYKLQYEFVVRLRGISHRRGARVRGIAQEAALRDEPEACGLDFALQGDLFDAVQ